MRFSQPQRRIAKFFRFFGRVGFVLLLLGNSMGYCAWDTDPRNPTFLWGTSTDPTIVSDGLGGAFFAFSQGNYWPHIGHVNAQGEQTFPIGSHPYEYLLPIESSQYAGTPIGATLVQSGPPETVIAVHERGLNGQYGGFVFSQFNTSGPSGFGSVGYVGQDYGLLILQDDDDHGWATIAGDLDGGVHFIMYGPVTNGQPSKYYNHVTSSGEFTHEWPGLTLPRNRWASYLAEDGYGGALLVQIESPQNQLDSLCGQHYDPDGQPQWGPNGRMIHSAAENVWAQFDLLSPGKVIFWGREEVEEDSFTHYGYCIDTSGTMVWGQDGITFECDGSEIIHLTPDHFGGFFYHSFVGAIGDGYGIGCHYGGNGNLTFAANVSFAARYADYLGGAYFHYFVDEVPPRDSTRIAYEHFDSYLDPLWEDSVYVIDIPVSSLARIAVPDEIGGIIGLVSTGPGIAFYHLNADGSLGPSLGVPREVAKPNDIAMSVFPNPFNSTLSISLDVPLHQDLSLTLYDLLGREVDVVYRGRVSTASISYSAPPSLASGIYFLRASAASQSVMRRVVLLK